MGDEDVDHVCRSTGNMGDEECRPCVQQAIWEMKNVDHVCRSTGNMGDEECRPCVQINRQYGR